MATDNRVRVVFEALTQNFVRNTQAAFGSVRLFGMNFRQDVNGINAEMDRTSKLANTLKTAIKAIAVGYVSKQLIGLAKDSAAEYAKTQTALGEMSSLGVKDLESLRKEAIKFSNTWSGTTREQFIQASYDIKSGIASLTDEGIAKFTSLSGMTAKATKDTIANMTTLFAKGYGIYRNSFMSDEFFGEAFSAGISKSVQQFRTTGTEMGSFLSALGATAQKAGADLSEVLSVGGTLQTTMSGSEAATRYRAFLDNVMKASKELGISFVDNNNKLLPTVEIVKKLRGVFGDTIDAVESAQLQKAFGTQEAVAFIKLMYDSTDQLAESQRSVADAMKQGSQFTKDMAQTMNGGMAEKAQILAQRFANFREQIGEKMSASVGKGFDRLFQAMDRMESDGTLDRIASSLGTLFSNVINLVIELVSHLDNIIQAVSNVASFFANNFSTIINVITGATIAFIAFKTVMSISAIIQTLAMVVNFLATALGSAQVAQWALNVAMYANPIGIVIALVVALVAIIGFMVYKIHQATGSWINMWTTFLIFMEKVKLGFWVFVRDFLRGMDLITRGLATLFGSIPLIGDAFKGVASVISNSLNRVDNQIDNTRNKIAALTSELQNSIKSEAKKDYYDRKSKYKYDEMLDQYVGKYTNPTAPSSIPQEPTVSASSGGGTSIPKTSSGGAKQPKTIQDKIRDVDDSFSDKEDLYESRMDLAQKKNNQSLLKDSRNSLVDTLKNKANVLLGMQNQTTGKDKNIVEAARNKLLSKIEQTMQNIDNGIQELVGEWNTPSELSKLTQYQHTVNSSQSVLNKTTAIAPDVKMYLTIADTDKKGAQQIRKEVQSFTQSIFANKNDLVQSFTQEVVRS